MIRLQRALQGDGQEEEEEEDNNNNNNNLEFDKELLGLEKLLGPN